jgi:hypothetical protein
VDEREVLRNWADRILGNDKELAKQVETLKALSSHEMFRPTIESVQERVGAFESAGPDARLGFETIVQRVGRPVLEIAQDDYIVEGPEAAIWESRLSNATVRTALRRVIPSVGRIEVDNHPDFTWVGTGWLIADDVVVTNRHVASEFAKRNGESSGPAFVFKRGWPDRNVYMTSRIDFRRELRNETPRAFAVRDILHIEDDDGFDFAFLKVERSSASDKLAPPLIASKDKASAQQYVATVGYPAADSRVPEADLMNRLFGDKYNVKRLAPGQVMDVSGDIVLHDCTTLGGNSGSPILDLASGQVVGLHFSGVFARENRGVPINYVFDRLNKLGRLRPMPEERRPVVNSVDGATTTGAGAFGSASSGTSLSGAATGSGTVTITIPLQLNLAITSTVSVGASLAGAGTSMPAGSDGQGKTAGTGAATSSIEAAVADIRAKLAGRDDVLNVRDGYKFQDGWITSERAVVVVLKDQAGTPEGLGLPAKSGGFPIDVRAADPWDFAEAQAKLETLEGVPPTSYKKPRDFKLEEVDETMSVTCHVSPDAGWPTLKEFLSETESRLTIGMYDFTAPHIVDGVLDAVRSQPKKLKLVMQEGAALSGKPDDIEEEKTIERYAQKLGGRFEHAPASVGKNRQFASAYHIKVAVRDGKAFWLSSGNWQSSNQPDHGLAAGEQSWDLLMDHNREWHAVIENGNLAKQFEKYLRYDFDNAEADAETEAVPPPELFFLVDDDVPERVPAGTATYFKPLVIHRRVRVMPLLTPDNYYEQALKLIKSAEHRLLFQNQSLSALGVDTHGNDKNDPRFAELVEALRERQAEGVDVRIIMRGEFAPVGPLEQLKKRGFDMSKVKLQNRCHTKGIIVDSSKVLIGSHNWTNQGTLVNRDASLIFDDDEIAEYFEEIFWFDWKNLARQSVSRRRVRRASSDEAALPAGAGTRVVSWHEIVNGD